MSSVKREQFKLVYPLSEAQYIELLNSVIFEDEDYAGGKAINFGQVVTANLIEGNTLVAHTIGKVARVVEFKDADGNMRGLQWVAVGTTGITVTSNEALTGVTITIIGF